MVYNGSGEKEVAVTKGIEIIARVHSPTLKMWLG